MRVLIACEESGTVRSAFEELGHEAWSCDLMPSRIPGNHIIGDARDVLHGGWDLLIAHPPCTRLANSGVCWLHKRNLWSELREGAELFTAFLTAPVPHIAVENPIPHKYAVELIGSSYDQKIQPWQFGHGETKATCLWLRGLPPLLPTDIVPGREQRIHRMSPSPTRARDRSVTYPGIAKAMAEQWSAYLRNA